MGIIFILAILGLAGCHSKKESAQADAPVHNAFVDHIERGQQTITTAESRVAAENARIKAQDQQAQQTE